MQVGLSVQWRVMSVLPSGDFYLSGEKVTSQSSTGLRIHSPQSSSNLLDDIEQLMPMLNQ